MNGEGAKADKRQADLIEARRAACDDVCRLSYKLGDACLVRMVGPQLAKMAEERTAKDPAE